MLIKTKLEKEVIQAVEKEVQSILKGEEHKSAAYEMALRVRAEIDAIQKEEEEEDPN